MSGVISRHIVIIIYVVVSIVVVVVVVIVVVVDVVVFVFVVVVVVVGVVFVFAFIVFVKSNQIATFADVSCSVQNCFPVIISAPEIFFASNLIFIDLWQGG